MTPQSALHVRPRQDENFDFFTENKTPLSSMNYSDINQLYTVLFMFIVFKVSCFI